MGGAGEEGNPSMWPISEKEAGLHLNGYLCKVSHSIHGVFRATGLQVQPAPVQVHLDSREEAWEPFGDAHGGWQINLDCKTG